MIVILCPWAREIASPLLIVPSGTPYCSIGDTFSRVMVEGRCPAERYCEIKLLCGVRANSSDRFTDGQISGTGRGTRNISCIGKGYCLCSICHNTFGSAYAGRRVPITGVVRFSPRIGCTIQRQCKIKRLCGISTLTNHSFTDSQIATTTLKGDSKPCLRKLYSLMRK